MRNLVTRALYLLSAQDMRKREELWSREWTRATLLVCVGCTQIPILSFLISLEKTFKGYFISRV